MSLTELQDSVLADAALHLPDIKYDVNSIEHRVTFETLLLSSLIDENERDVAGLRIVTDLQDAEAMQSFAYAFTPWSRSQLLSRLGTREKWFSLVTLERQVEELNARLHGFQNYRIRTMRAVDDGFPIRLVRGLVSSQYAEISNVDIMEAVITKAEPTSRVLRGCSGISDRAFYAYIMSPEPITIPNTSFFAYPGVVVKNSEVGYTSLWVIPTIVTSLRGVPVVIESAQILKRIHRGQADLLRLFDEAFSACAGVWAAYATKIPTLAAKAYHSEDVALATMERLLLSASARREFIGRCSTAYKAKPRRHTALDIFEAITEACAELVDRDETYSMGAIAGAVLHKLTF